MMMKTFSLKYIPLILLTLFLFFSICFALVFAVTGFRGTSGIREGSERFMVQMEALHICRESRDAAGIAAERYFLNGLEKTGEGERGKEKTGEGAEEAGKGANEPGTISRVAENELEFRLREFRKSVSELQLLLEKEETPLKTWADELARFARHAHMAFVSCASAREEAFGDPGAEEEFRANAMLLSGALGACSDCLQNSFRCLMEEISQWQGRVFSFFPMLWRLSAVFFLAAFFFVLLIPPLIRRSMRKSLLTLSEGTKTLRGGNLGFRFREITPDEIGEVKYDFNMMARRIEMQSTELLRANEELRRQAEDLIEAHQHKDRFLSNMSHELRTPLNSIIGFSELIGERAERLGPEKLRSYSKRILTAAEHLLSLITSLLDLAKSDAGTLKPVFSNFDLSFAVAEMAAMLRPLAEKKSLTLETEIEKDLQVFADQRMIKQIFINLLGNAIKFTEKGGIRVRLYREKGPSSSSSSSSTAADTPAAVGAILLEVEDTGIGIPEEEIKHLFRDFHRVDNGPAHMVDGVGIGLALSRRLAALHGASIRVRSRYGEGSVFTLALPAERASDAGHADA